VLYGIRGLLLLLLDWLKGLLKRRRPPRSPGSGPAGGTPQTPGGGGPSGSSGPSAAGTSGKAASTGAASAAPGPAAAERAAPAPVPNALSTPAPQAPRRQDTERATAEARTAEQQPSGGLKPQPEPAAPAATPDKPKPAAKKGAAAKKSGAAKKSAAKKTSGENRASAARVQKKAARRGIRLKSGDAGQSGFD